MKNIRIKLQNTGFYRLYQSFSPSSRSAMLFALPFILVDAIHYYTAGTALIFSFPLVILIYLLCGAYAAKLASQEVNDLIKISNIGRSAGFRLWISSTVINIVLAVILGFTSLGITLVSSAIYLCLFAPLNAIASALIGWLGGWMYQQYFQRTHLA